MAITTAAQAVAGMLPPVYFSKATGVSMIAGVPFNISRPNNGTPVALANPGAAVSPATRYTSKTGQLPFPAADGRNTYLAKFSAISSANAGTLLLCDYLYDGTLALNATSSNAPSSYSLGSASITRDENGDVLGAGVHIAAETLTQVTGTPVVDFLLRNQNDAQGQYTQVAIPWSSSQNIGTFIPVSEPQVGGGGVTTGITRVSEINVTTAGTGGSVGVIGYRVLASLELRMTNQRATVEFPSVGMPRLYDNTVPFLVFIPSGTAATTISGSITYAKG